jgi:hypothetical protein
MTIRADSEPAIAHNYIRPCDSALIDAPLVVDCPS